MRLLPKGAMLVAVLALLLFAASNANASACVSNATGNWSAAGTWTACAGGIPLATDTVEIRGDRTVTVDVSNAVAASIQIGGNPGTLGGTLTFNAGSRVTVSGSVTVGGATSTTHGTLTMTNGGAAARNVISGNGYSSCWDCSGLQIFGGSGNTVLGNYIGTAAAGTSPVANLVVGVLLSDGANNNTIGGPTASARNVISGNSNSGVAIFTATSNNVLGNYIGTNKDGTAALPNDQTGIYLYASADNNTIGGTATGTGNLISGNTNNGIVIHLSSGNFVQGNYIGTNAAGTAAIGNGNGLVIMATSTNNTIGGTVAGARNIISGNTSDGVKLTDVGTTGNLVQANYVGTNAAGTAALANSRHGVYVLSGAASNTIGGTAANAGNLISGNAGKGVVITDGNDNAVLSNSIYANTGIGIDLADDGVTANDGTKSGALANSGMDTPVFTTTTLAGTTLTVAGYVGSAAGQATFASASVEVFKSDNDASGFGEGQTLLGTLTTDASGNFSGTLTVSLAVGDKITGTATDASNNTSELGSNATVTLAIKTWDGGAGTSNWGDAANWSTNGVPISTDNVDLTGADTININVAAVANNLTLNNAGLVLTINSGNSLAVSGPLALTSGTLNMGTNTISGAGSFTLGAGGNLGIGSTAGITSSGATGNVQVSGTRTFSTGANYNYNGTAPQVTGNGLPATVNNLTVAAASTLTSSADLSASGTLTLDSSAVFDLGTYALSGMPSTIIGTGTLKTQNTSLTPLPAGATWTGTVQYNNATGGQTIVVGTYSNLTNSNTSGNNTGRGAISVSDTLTLAASSSLNMLNNAILSGAITTITGTGTLKTQNASAAPIPSGKTWPGSIYYNRSTGGQTIAGGTYTNFYNQNTSGINTVSSDITVNNILTLNNSSVLDLGTSVLTTSASVVSGSGILKTQSTSATPIPAGITWVGTVEYNNPTGGQVVVAGNYAKFTNSNTSGVNTSSGTVTVDNTLTLNASSTLDMATYVLSGTLSTIAGTGRLKTQNTSATPIPSGESWSGTVEYNATAGQTIVAGTYDNLEINTSGTNSVSGNITIGGTLAFTGGTITTGANTLYVNATGTVSRVSGHVIGNFKKNVATGATSKTFEVGDASNYTPVTVAFASVTTAGDLTASTTSGDHANIGTSAIDSAQSVNRHWTLTNSGIVFTNYDATFTFVAGDLDGGANTSAFIVGNYSGGSWAYPTVGTKTATSTQATGLAAFSTFQLGEASALPPNVPLVNSVLPSGPQPPGTDLVYTVVFTNDGGQAAQVFIVVDPIPEHTDFKLGSAGTVLGTTGMTVAVEFSNDDAETWTYTPVSGADGAPAGYDRTVTHVRWSFTGNLSQTAPNNTGSVTLTARIR